MPSTTGPGPGRPEFLVPHESISEPINYRDASGGSVAQWKNPPTAITVPANTGHPRRTLRAHDSPYTRMSNNLVPKSRRLGNPNVKQTLLAKVADGSVTPDYHPRKRQKLGVSVSTSLTLNGASSSFTRDTSPSNVFEPDVQPTERRRRTNNHTNSVPNNAEIIDLGASSDDLGEHIPRPVKSSSPDPLLIQNLDMGPTEHRSSAPRKGKARAKEEPEIVEGSEGSEEIEQFSSPVPTSRPSGPGRSPKIPKNIVQVRKNYFESTSVSAPAAAAIRHPVEKMIRVDLTRGMVIGQMKKKNEGALESRINTSTSDFGTSSSHFLNSPRAKESDRALPLEACCIGHHLFRHSDTTSLELAYNPSQQKVKITWHQSPPEVIEFKLSRDVSSAIVVNDDDAPLRENVVVQFIAAQGQEWKSVECRYKGFERGGQRGQNKLTLLFATMKHRGFSATRYQTFVTWVKKLLEKPAVETIRPLRGKGTWEYAFRLAEMFEQQESRKMEDCDERSIVDEPLILARSASPCSSTSIKTRTSHEESKVQNGDSRLSTPQRRSSRQSAMRSSRIPSPLLLSALSEPDEVILLYPPTGTGALSMMHSDLMRLQPEEYLNDTLIEFGLKLWLNDVRERDPTLADQIHVFSSFFYKKLNNRKNLEEGYKSVRKWTSKIDLFAKKYVIVPINENIHWYLAIIYEPGHTLESPLPLSSLSGVQLTRKRKKIQERAQVDVETGAVPEPALTEDQLTPPLRTPEGVQDVDMFSVNATRATTPSTTENEMVIDKSCSEPVSATSSGMSGIQIRGSSPSCNLLYPPDYIVADADVAPDATRKLVRAPDSSGSKQLSAISTAQFYGEAQQVVVADREDSGEEREQEAEVDDMLTVAQSPPSDWAAQTYIFTLDSLGTRHLQAIKVLKQYLAWEAKDKRNFDEVRDPVGKQVQVPVQPNTWDCGIYLLHFVKVFMSAPSEIFEKIITTRGTMSSSERRKMWQDYEIPEARDYLKSRILELSEEWKAEKTVREEANKRGDGHAVVMGVSSSEGEVDIVEDTMDVKSRLKRPATRLRG